MMMLNSHSGAKDIRILGTQPMFSQLGLTPVDLAGPKPGKFAWNRADFARC